MEAYKRWVRRNRDYVHSLESLANGLTWLLPERFSDSEIGPEAGFVKFCNFYFGYYHRHQRTYTRDDSNTDANRKKWNFMAVTEGVKVLLRLAILQKNGYKMLLHGGETVNDKSESDPGRSGPLPRPGPQGVSGILKNHHGQTPWNLEGRALSALNRFGENARTVSEPTWLRRVQHQQEVVEPPTPVAETPSLSTFLSEKGVPGGLFLTGEVMCLLRPLIYVLLIRKYGARSWFPWLTSLGVDLVGNGIISFVTMKWHNSKDFRLSNLEKNELKRRKLLWALYLMRDPFFTKYTRQKLDGTQKQLEPVPIIGLLTEKLVELLVGAQTRYTYMSGS